MKTFLIVLIGLVASVVGMSPAFAASELSSGYYAAGSLGASRLTDSDYTLSDGGVYDSGKFTFDRGIAVTGVFGKQMSHNRLEIELGRRDNKLDSTKIDGGITLDLGADVNALSVMVNGYHDFINTDSKFTPYIGAGLGMARLTVDSDDFGDDRDTVGAFQIMVGGGYDIGDQFSIDISYRYFATEDPQFGGIDSGIEAEYATHGAMLGLRKSF